MPPAAWITSRTITPTFPGRAGMAGHHSASVCRLKLKSYASSQAVCRASGGWVGGPAMERAEVDRGQLKMQRFDTNFILLKRHWSKDMNRQKKKEKQSTTNCCHASACVGPRTVAAISCNWVALHLISIWLLFTKNPKRVPRKVSQVRVFIYFARSNFVCILS